MFADACVSSVLSSVQPQAIRLAGAGYSFLHCLLCFHVWICVLCWLCCSLLFRRRSLALHVLAPAIRFELLWPLLLPGVQPQVFGLQVLASVRGPLALQVLTLVAIFPQHLYCLCYPM